MFKKVKESKRGHVREVNLMSHLFLSLYVVPLLDLKQDSSLIQHTASVIKAWRQKDFSLSPNSLSASYPLFSFCFINEFAE